ncbi:MAG: hypothetical protein WKF36_07905 [Candidatus Nitrosocosmicus sp.]
MAAGVGQMLATAICWQNWLITMRKGAVANNMEHWRNGHMCVVNYATKWPTKRKMNQLNPDEDVARLG